MAAATTLSTTTTVKECNNPMRQTETPRDHDSNNKTKLNLKKKKKKKKKKKCRDKLNYVRDKNFFFFFFRIIICFSRKNICRYKRSVAADKIRVL